MSRDKKLSAALVGNPNTGKTTLFNALSGLRQRTGNYPGVTVETKKGSMTCGGQPFELIDLPGTYSLAPRSPDEMVAVDVILGRQQGEARPDVVVSIVDASNLDRNLYLTSQVMELGVPVVVALNMIDVARDKDCASTWRTCRRASACPSCRSRRIGGSGWTRCKRRYCKSQTANCELANGATSRRFVSGSIPNEEVAALRGTLGEEVPHFLVRRLLLDAGGYHEKRLSDSSGNGMHLQSAFAISEARQRLAAAGCPVPAVEAKTRYGWIRQITAGCVESPKVRPVTWTDRLDRILTHKVWGTLIFLAVMFVVFQSIFTWAKPLMKVIGDGKDLLAERLDDRAAVRGCSPACCSTASWKASAASLCSCRRF